MPSPGRSCMPLFLQLRPVPFLWPGHMCLLFSLPSTGYGPLTVNTSSLDSFRPSSVQIAPCASQSSVTGRMIVTSPSVLSLTVIRHSNTFEHYGSGGLDMMGWDPLRSGLLPLFGFSQYDAGLLHQQLLDTIPEELSLLDFSSPLSVGDFRAAVANRTAARFSDLDKALSALASAGECDILTRNGKVRQKGLIRLDSSDLIALPSRPMFPGWSRLDW